MSFVGKSFFLPVLPAQATVQPTVFQVIFCQVDSSFQKLISMPDKCTLIYVMSDVRSGSTLLENILSKSEETVSVGEMALLKNHIFRTGPGAKWNWNCSCGMPPSACPFWSRVLSDVSVTDPHFNTAVEWNYRSRKMFAGSVISSFIKTKFRQLSNKKINIDTIATNIELYRKIFRVSGKKFIVDSSKDPVQAYLTYLNKPDDFDVKIISLNRDLRAIAASKSKWSVVNKKKKKSLRKWLTNSLFYKKICFVVAKLVQPADVVSVAYEDLASHTQQQLDTIAKVCGLQPYLAPKYMVVEDDHTIAGTPQRFTKRPIVYDNSWEATYEKKPVLFFLGKILNTL